MLVLCPHTVHRPQPPPQPLKALESLALARPRKKGAPSHQPCPCAFICSFGGKLTPGQFGPMLQCIYGYANCTLQPARASIWRAKERVGRGDRERSAEKVKRWRWFCSVLGACCWLLGALVFRGARNAEINVDGAKPEMCPQGLPAGALGT